MTIDHTAQRGTLSQDQVQALLRPINPKRVVTGPHVKPHVSQQDVVAHLSRVLGFGGFDVEVRESACILDEPMTNSHGKDAWRVGYRALVRLIIRNAQGEFVASYDGGSTGESEGQPSRVDSHDLAYKSALSTATKRAAIHLGDQFGLSLYNKGQMSALVLGTLVLGDGRLSNDRGDIQDGVEQQEVDGGLEREREEQPTEAEAPQAPSATPAKTPARGRQGTKRGGTVKPEPQPEPTPEPEATPEPEPTKAQVLADDAERAQREADAAEQTRIAAEAEAAAEQTPPPADDEPEPAPEEDVPMALQAPQYVDAQGTIYESQEAMDAALKAKRQEAQQPAAEVPPAPPAAEAAAGDFVAQAKVATSDEALRAIWQEANRANALTAELRAVVVARRDEVKGA